MISIAKVRFISVAAFPAAQGVAAANCRLSRFRRSEDGSIMIFGLLLFTTILLLVGVSLDVMRFETERTRAQYTLDRAVLAAADISQTVDAQTVVDDYFAKAGIEKFEPVATATKGTYNEWKKVVGTLDVTTDTWFMRMVGVDTLETAAAATAEEKIGNVEISMVLDISGSMDDKVYDSQRRYIGTKISLLRAAASSFVDTMFTNVQGAGTNQGKLSISVVPYHQQVQLTTDFADYLNLTNEHVKSACVDFFSSDYNTTSITATQSLPRTAHADARSSSSTRSPSFRECYSYSYATMLPFSSDKTAIKSKISGLEAEGDTAIDIGAKWGIALLDPAMQDVMDEMIQDGGDAALKGRPFDWNYIDTMKIMVLMTDGQNTNTYAVREPYRNGPSPMYWYKSGSTKYYLYYRPEKSGDYDYYYYNQSNGRGYWYRERDLGTLTQMTYQELWETFSLEWYGRYYFDNAANVSTDFADLAIAHADASDKNARLKSVCDAAKAKGVTVFAIAYEATLAGQTALKNCVSADSYYYDAQGSSIADAFAGIANAINMLRLTQ
ncbi:Tad domain-containing protein [Frigidibacter sp.]|uniref:Tad domain-containing protein n=1 Tax=Frigidibacter sp. TaxID=2586418 RepID=UPI002732C63B|nr:Tad domain-containing protein [Frigidibacter sp.]MDP3342579.1 Tad domain-containing protein [Frigidibacter sp.]